MTKNCVTYHFSRVHHGPLYFFASSEVLVTHGSTYGRNGIILKLLVSKGSTAPALLPVMGKFQLSLMPCIEIAAPHNYRISTLRFKFKFRIRNYPRVGRNYKLHQYSGVSGCQICWRLFFNPCAAFHIARNRGHIKGWAWSSHFLPVAGP